MDTRVLCPLDVKKMFMRQARRPIGDSGRPNTSERRSLAGSDSGYAAKKFDEEWTDKHRNVMRKLVVEEGWVQRRLCDIR